MPTLKQLATDPRFVRVSERTKADILGTIGFDIETARDEVKNSKFTKAQLMAALHYLLAKTVKQNPNVRAYLRQDASAVPAPLYSSSSYSSYRDPFYFSHNDPFLWYLLLNNNNVAYQHSGGSFFPSGGGHRSGGGGSNNDQGGALILVTLCACSAIICCACCNKMTADGPESRAVKQAKITGSTLTGLAVFVVLMTWLNSQNILQDDLVENRNWSEGGYRTFLLLISVFGAFLMGGIVATINNAIACLPKSKDEAPPPLPSPEVLEAVSDLAVIETLLIRGWDKSEDDPEACRAFIREVILCYIDTIANEQLEARADNQPNAAAAASSAHASMFASASAVPANSPGTSIAPYYEMPKPPGGM